MEKRNWPQAFSFLEVFLPLLFYAGHSVFAAAALIPCVAGITLIFLELLRRQPPRLMEAFYMVWLALCGLGAWYGLGVAPYWIWGVHLLISETARRPTEAQRKKPFLFGFKKYAFKRTREFAFVLAGALAVSAALYYLRTCCFGVSVWITGILVLASVQMLAGLTRRVKA
ncbi:MAG TPA: hypothetical protein DIS66_02670 [Candidatus Omnitrophica bacterium]|nr:hypothetical protein [Candidatus Omnitrophota bacterium]